MGGREGERVPVWEEGDMMGGRRKQEQTQLFDKDKFSFTTFRRNIP